MKYLKVEDLTALGWGAAILGSGGGGDPVYELKMAKFQMEKYGEIPLVSLEELRDDDLIAPMGFMGAPLVGIEKLPSGQEFVAILAMIEKFYGKRPTHLMPAEIGGSNAFTPLCVARRMGLPVLDADTIGRAFPELQMSSCNLHGIPSSPAFLADALGQRLMIEAKSGLATEALARAATVAMGSNTAISLYLMTGKEAKKAVIGGSISRAIALGKAAEVALKEGLDPVEAVVSAGQGKSLAQGMITDIVQEVKDGFLEGSFTLACEEGDVKVVYQNENLMTTRGKQVLAITPDIIIPLERESGTAITSESLQYGLRVELISLPSPEIWKTKEGLELVGPKYFNLEQ